jgi:hypothetical protein
MPVGIQPTREQIDQELTSAAQSLRQLGMHLQSMVQRYTTLGPTGLMGLPSGVPGGVSYDAAEAAEVLRFVAYFGDFVKLYGGGGGPAALINYSDEFAAIENSG